MYSVVFHHLEQEASAVEGLDFIEDMNVITLDDNFIGSHSSAHVTNVLLP